MKSLVAGLLAVMLAACASAPPSRGTILVVGASSGTGLEITKLLAQRGEDVTAFVRPTSDRSGLAGLPVKYAVGDATDAASVRQAFAGHNIRAVVSTLGGRAGEPRPDLIGTRNFIDAAKAAGVKRMLLITVIGAGDSASVLPERVRASLAQVVPLKTASEEYLEKSGLDYTIIRPGGLRNAPDSGHAILTLDHTAFSAIGRAELARLTVGAIDDKAAVDKIYHAYDPTAAK
jgi:uncharacterized protein YbjT (DUF2867 family)